MTDRLVAGPAADSGRRPTAMDLPTMDLNADLGEGFGVWRLGDDTALMSVVTSANIACGFHAGDPLTMRLTCRAALAHGVAIGAQVSYHDLAGFGRRPMDVPFDELAAEILYQLSALDGIARSCGGRLSYVKPHGALYNRVVRDRNQAAAVAEAVLSFDPSLPVLTLPGSVLSEVDDQHRRLARHHVGDPRQSGRQDRGAQRVGVRGLHQEPPVARPPDVPHANRGLPQANGTTWTPASPSALRTDLASSTAPGVSPCTQIDLAETGTTVPSIASISPSTAIRTARSATSRGSVMTATGERRGTSVPSGV